MKTKASRRIGLVAIAVALSAIVLVASTTLALGGPGGPPPDETGTLEINKVLNAGTSDYQKKDFEILVTDGNGYTHQEAFKNGPQPISLDLPPGDYTVTEVGLPDDVECDPASGISAGVFAGEVTSVHITNTYVEPTPSSGQLKWNGVHGASVNQGCPNGGSLTWILTPGGNVDLLSGTLYVEFLGNPGVYIDFPGYFPSGQTGHGSMHFDSDGESLVKSAYATFSYTGTLGQQILTISHSNYCYPPPQETGSLTIDKELVDAPTGTTKNNFTLTVSGPSFSSPVEVPGHELPKTFTELIPGTYAVGESYPGPNWTVEGTGDVEVEANKTTTATVTNSYTPPPAETGTLVVIKRVDGGGPLAADGFIIDVSGTRPDGSPLQEGIPGAASPGISFTLKAGTAYSVSEETYSNYTTTYEGDPATGNIPNGGMVTVIVVNTYVPPEIPTGELRIEKLLNDPQEQFTVDQFRVRVTGPGGYNQTHRFPGDGTILLTGLTPGTYRVVEIGLPPAATFNVTMDPSDGVAEVPSGEQVLVTVTNTRTVTSSTSTPPTSESPETTEPTPPTSDQPETTEPTPTTSDQPDATEPPVSPETTVPSNETTVPSSETTTTSTSTTEYPVTSTPTPKQIQTGGGGTAGPGAGVWALAGLAAALGIGLSASGLRSRQKAKR